MEINLAGYNIDLDILNSLNIKNPELLTPEIFSAAYARISRSKKSVTELRKQAREDVKKARKSNSNIIFGMGHHSVAEHAVFNFDLIGVSRLALEEIEKFRLVSYTEKSQRYVTLDGDYIIPEEIIEEELLNQFKENIMEQNSFYNKAYKILKDDIFKKNPDINSKAEKRTLEGWAKEDARYILSLSTKGQVGLTINARNLEHLFRKFALSKYSEVREIGRKIYSLVCEIAPSIILFPNPSEFEKKTSLKFEDILSEIEVIPSKKKNIHEIEIINHTPDGDDLILISMLALKGNISYSDAVEKIKGLSFKKKEEIFKNIFESLEFFDTLPREFELPEITFKATISASNFAQLKRHRIATLLISDYDPNMMNTIPERIIKNGLKDEFEMIINKTNSTYFKLKNKYPNSADYILTNSHKRTVIMKINLRSLYHFIRLREDKHTQWDIRNMAALLSIKVKKIFPLSTMLLCGKSDYTEQYKKIFSKEPKVQY